jgi:oleate hydratase
MAVGKLQRLNSPYFKRVFTMSSTLTTTRRSELKAYLVGGGIASLASAAYLIRDGGFAGSDLCIFEAGSLPGGSLDGAGSPEEGYVIRGGRMFAYEAYTCTFDLLSFIPSLTDPAVSVTDEIHEFNTKHVSHSQARLVKNGTKVDAAVLGFSSRDRLDLYAAAPDGSWALWETLASKHSDFGRPAVFNGNPDESK